MLCDAMIDRPKKMASRLGTFGELVYTLSPKTADIVLNTAYNLFPESAAAKKARPASRYRPTRRPTARCRPRRWRWPTCCAACTSSAARRAYGRNAPPRATRLS